ncbi:MAG TPA: 30S ribosomal protein S15 [Patescibacteria group bacterium]|nr:30S ribosomal protein S15 [Patescibacteria group bacterium]
MSLTTDEKTKLIEKYKTHKGDTGSPEVQVALITERIQRLTKHLEIHPQDVHSRTGLLSMVSKRRRLLNYLQRKDDKRYKSVVNKLNLSK